MSRSQTILSATLAAGLACAPASPAPLDLDRALVSRARSEAEALLREQTSLAWTAWMTGEPVRAQPASARPWIVAPSTLDAVRRTIRSEASHDARRALRYLHALLVREHLMHSVAELDDRIAGVMAGDIELDGEPIAYRDLRARLAEETDPLRRRRLAEAALPLYEEVNPLLEQRARRLQVVARTIGYQDPIRLATEIRRFSIHTAARLAEQMLASSDALYLAALRELAPPEVGVPLQRLAGADLPRLRQSPRFAAWFSAKRMMPALDATLAGLGMPREKLPIYVDARHLPRKRARAACFPIVVPGDVRLSVKSSGGVAAYSVLLHEMGHALRLAHTRTLVFELQLLGDGSAAKAMALVIEGLAHEPTWLSEQLGMAEPELTDYARLVALKRLLVVREHAARLLFEIEWLRGSRNPASEIYSRHMSRAYGFALEHADAAPYLVGQDPFLVSADYLRGWLLAAQITGDLRARFGGRWWTRPEAGAALRELWAAGQRDTAEEIATKLGLGPLRPEPLLTWAANALVRGPTTAVAR